jgi:uncharacterized protein YggU (UPF0235/DUF167 family)
MVTTDRKKILVIVHPKSKNPRIEKDLIKRLHVYVKSLPLEGKANKETIQSLAKFFGIKKNKIILIRGKKSKIKMFEIY